MLPASWKKNDKKARIIIFSFSAIVFIAVVLLGRVTWNLHPGFDPHIFAKANAVINSTVTCLLLIAFIAVRKKKYTLHRNLMLTAIVLSVFFLLSYVCHHLLSPETRFGDLNHDGILSEAERSAAGGTRYFYYALLGIHIPLAGIVLPFILFTAYRGLTGDYTKHKKLVRISYPLWLFVAISGVIIYFMIAPYYT
jgi:putative membrane protein